jgi:peroxiredoxin
MVEKLLLHFPLLSDPNGQFISSYGLWEERGLLTPRLPDREPMAIPAIVVVGSSGTIRYVYAGVDFADRPGDESVFAALEGNGP